MIEPSVYIPQAEFWNCQLPASADAGEWAIVSASMIEDGHNCLWLMNFPHTSLAGGSMYAFQLPGVIPRVGDPNGPPPPEAQRNFGGLPGPDSRLLFLKCIRDPSFSPPWITRAQYEAEMARRKAQRQSTEAPEAAQGASPSLRGRPSTTSRTISRARSASSG